MRKIPKQYIAISTQINKDETFCKLFKKSIINKRKHNIGFVILNKYNHNVFRPKSYKMPNPTKKETNIHKAL